MKRALVLVAAVFLAAGAGWAQTAASVEQEILKLEQAGVDALIKKDRAALERIYADDYVYTHSNGSVQTRAQELAEVASGDVKWTSGSVTDLKVRVYGDVAVAMGVVTLQGTAKGYVPGPRRFTDIFVRRGGRWVQVGGQSTIVPAAKPSSN